MDSDNNQTNPWAVENLDYFLHFCCPECDVKEKSKEQFLEHAINQHPHSKEHFNKEKERVKEEPLDYDTILDYNDQVKCNVVLDDDFIDDTDADDLFNGENIKAEDYYMDNDTFEEVDEDFDKHICNLCNKPFSSRKYLKIHIKTVHEGLKEKKCHLCDKVYAHATDLSVHIKKIHEGFKYECNLCDKSYADPRNLSNHIRWIHKGIKNHKCETCGKSFTTGQALRRHNEHVHEGIAYQERPCKFCDEIFKVWYKKSFKILMKNLYIIYC